MVVAYLNLSGKDFSHYVFHGNSDYLFFHSYMSDYFLGTYGGGIPKPFRLKVNPKLSGEQPISLLSFLNVQHLSG
jgi:hypothetical protein